MKLQESGEMYLETILVLTNRNGYVRSIDISEEMGYSKPSVSRAMGLLKEGGYIRVDAAGHITLTESGMKVASKIYDRHNTLSESLIKLGVTPEVAVEDACRWEHIISDESVAALKKHIADMDEAE